MIPIQGSKQTLNKNFNPFANKKTVAASGDLANQSNQSSGQPFISSQTFNTAPDASPVEKRARATNMLNNKFYGTGGRLDLYA